MPPKQKSIAGSSQSFDSAKFLSYETQKKYIDQKKIHVIQERGLVQKLQHIVNWTIDANKWVSQGFLEWLQPPPRLEWRR